MEKHTIYVCCCFFFTIASAVCMTTFGTLYNHCKEQPNDSVCQSQDWCTLAYIFMGLTFLPSIVYMITQVVKKRCYEESPLTVRLFDESSINST